MKKYVIAGTSYRGFYMYAEHMVREFSDCAQIVGLYDLNHKRCEFYNRELKLNAPIYSDFEQMIAETKPDVVIVTTIDRFHHEYIIRAMEAGCDVMCEKPLTIDAEKIKLICDAKERTGKNLIVTFNYRFSVFAARLKKLLMTDVIGDLYSVHFEWMLDTDHGADYFRRWHRNKANSGGLLVHKATHHFDLVNWLIEQEPVAVNAFGNRRFYGPTRERRSERCYDCPYRNSCEFFYDITADYYVRSLYKECEDQDGYYRDRCVFSEEIDIEDTMSVNVRYSGGAMMSYSLVAHSPYEGYKLSISGSKGRLEAENYHGAVGFSAGKNVERIRIYNREEEEIEYHLPPLNEANAKSHGGGDIRMLRMLLRDDMEDPLHQVAGLRNGVMSIIIGIAANLSMEKGRQIKIADLIDTDHPALR